jgi:P4 family phage/plasmid primase-like protien
MSESPKELDDNILDKLPYEVVDDREKWVKTTCYYQSIFPTRKKEWADWCQKCKRYKPSWEKENNRVWETVKLCDASKAMSKLTLLTNGEFISDRVKELFNIYSNLSDENKVDDLINQYKNYWKVVDYKKDIIYVFNQESYLWEKTHKDSLIGYLTKYYSPKLNELEKLLVSKPELFNFDLQDINQLKKYNLILSKINQSKNIPSKTQTVKEFFNRKVLYDSSFEEKLNADKTFLSVQGGKVDLKTGLFSLRTYEDYMSYELKTKYVANDIENHEWIQFLKSIFDNELIIKEQKEIIDYLQKYLGYCITGLTREEKILILFGKGGNGKSKLQNILYKVLEADIPIIDTWNSSLFDEKIDSGNANNASPEISKLQGKRLGFINESGKGVTWGETFKKLVDTGLSITSRKLYCEPVTFSLETTFLMATNDFPNIPIEDCYDRRILTIPLLNHYTANPVLSHHRPIKIGIENLILKDERAKEKILWWLVSGAIKYFRDGLGSLPPICQSCKDKHFLANDWTKLLEFVNDESIYMTQEDLYSMINSNTNIKINKNELHQKLEELGISRKRKMINGKKIYIYTGIREKVELVEEDECLIELEEENNPLDC